MDRTWYLRLSGMILSIVVALLALWPTAASDEYNIVPGDAPAWVQSIFPNRIRRGLDIQGGLRLAYDVEVEEAVEDLRLKRADDLRDEVGRLLDIIPENSPPTDEQLQQLAQRVTITLSDPARGDQIEATEGSRRMWVTFRNEADANRLTGAVLTERFSDHSVISRNGPRLILELKGARIDAIRDEAVDQAKQTVSGRIDELGVSETSVSTHDEELIVELPGRNEADFVRIREIIGRTARLEFKIVDDDQTFISTLTNLPEGIEMSSEAVEAGPDHEVVNTFLVARGEGSREKLLAYIAQLQAENRIPNGREILIGRHDAGNANQLGAPEAWRSWFLRARTEISGEDIADAFVANNPDNGRPYVAVNFNQPDGARTFEQLTERNVRRRMAIVLDDRVESAPSIRNRIPGGRCQIEMGGNRLREEIQRECADLVIVLKAGALPAPIRRSHEQRIGPTLGADAVRRASIGASIGVAVSFLFLVMYYAGAGLIAGFMVLLNLLLLLGGLALINATLTLPGIAGVVLTVGMAVDANVLINERIREELRLGKTARSAVDQGYKRAITAILDSQITTALAGVVLWQFGTGPIVGFAITLLVGIVTSLFTGVFCSHVVMDWVVRGLRVQRLSVG